MKELIMWLMPFLIRISCDLLDSSIRIQCIIVTVTLLLRSLFIVHYCPCIEIGIHYVTLQIAYIMSTLLIFRLHTQLSAWTLWSGISQACYTQNLSSWSSSPLLLDCQNLMSLPVFPISVTGTHVINQQSNVFIFIPPLLSDYTYHN